MTTLAEYRDFLYSRGYKETEVPYFFTDNDLETVDFTNGEYITILQVTPTDEFAKEFANMPAGVEWEVDYNNYIVIGAFIESSICNIANFLSGNKEGIYLVNKPGDYYKHSLDLFEKCIGFQKLNLLEQELFIMSSRVKQMEWAKDNFIPVLERCNYTITYDSFFDINYMPTDRDSSDVLMVLKHYNGDQVYLCTDCITGKLSIQLFCKEESITSDLTDKLFNKSKEEVYSVLLEEVWKKDELRYGYLYNNDPHETVDTCHEYFSLLDCLHYHEKVDINLDIIPARYNKTVQKYKELTYD